MHTFPTFTIANVKLKTKAIDFLAAPAKTSLNLLPTWANLNYQEGFAQSALDKSQQHFPVMQGGCQPRSIPYISTDAGEEHAVPGREQNRQDDREIKEKRKKQKGRAWKGPWEKDCLNMVMQQDHYHPCKGRGFWQFYRCGIKLLILAK